MKSLSMWVTLIVCALWASLAAAASNSAPSPVVVELFTSEGCSSCPPADALLAKLEQSRTSAGGAVLVLGEHVTYWDHQGWKDRFSSSELTERQEQYSQKFGVEPYTPQMVIDGHYQVSGNDPAAIVAKITLAAEKPKEETIALAGNGDKLTVEASGPDQGSGDVWLAITEDGLSTAVAHGENGGRTLKHSGVVRELRSIGSLKHGQLSKTIALKLDKQWKPENLRVIVFVQNRATRQITGASEADYRQLMAKASAPGTAK